MQPGKILIASSSPPDRGAGINAYAVELSESLVSLGVEVHYLSPPPRDRSWLARLGISHLAADQYSEPVAATREIIRYVAEHRIEGAINNDNPFLQSAAPGLGCALVVVGHMDRRSVGALACFQHEWVDHVVAISSDMQRAFVGRYGVPVTKCPIVYNGVRDPGSEVELTQRTPGLLRVVYAGGYSYNKGSKLVLAAVESGAQHWEGVHLEWFGDVPAAIARRLAGCGYVTLHGRVPREALHEALVEADVFLLPSRKEGCLMVLVEAMSVAAVPISSDGIGAMRWLVTTGRDGFICQLDDFPSQLLECLGHLRSHPEVLVDMKRATRERYRADLQSVRVAEHLLQLLRRPTVDRSQPPHRIPVLRWHRPLLADLRTSPLVDRFCIRLGILRRAGTLDLTA